MELEKEILELKSQLSLAMLLANKAMDMAVQATVAVKVAEETRVKRIEMPEPTPEIKEFLDEFKKEAESEAVAEIKQNLSPYATLFGGRRKEAKGIDQTPPISEDEEIWDSASEGEM